MDVETFQKECHRIHDKLSEVIERENPIPEIAMAALMSLFSTLLFEMKVQPALFQKAVDGCAKAYQEMWDEAKTEKV